jgi:hypothetical protein
MPWLERYLAERRPNAQNFAKVVAGLAKLEPP